MVNIDACHIMINTPFFHQHFYSFILLENLENTTVRNDRIMDIYDEDEEMRGEENEETGEKENEGIREYENEASEDENEVSEDDIELESVYERLMTEFNESDEDKDDREETSEEEDSEEEVIIDQPLNSDQMPHSFGEFAPYFKNITESLFFCWMQKHRICMLD